MNVKNLSIMSKIILGSVIPLIFLMVLAVISIRSSKSLQESSRWVDHTHTVIREALDIQAAAVDMETGMRGYLLAGQEQFLDPYSGGRQRFDELVTELKNTVSDNPAQVQLLDGIKESINGWVTNVTEPTIEFRREIGHAKTMDDMADLVGEARGKKYFDKFRGQIATFIGREQELMDQRKQKATKLEDIMALREATQWIDHTHNVIREALDIQAAAVDMETGMRGYLLAGQEQFLDPYNGGRQRFDQLVAELTNTVSDNPAQVQLLGEIKENINGWVANVTEPTIELRRQIGDAKSMNDMAGLVGEARGKKYFDKFRGQITTFIGREQELMDQRKESAVQSAHEAEIEVLVGAAVAIVIGVLSSIILTRTIVGPIRKMVTRLKDIAEGEGDLTQRVDQDRKDELGDLAKWFNAFVGKVHDVVAEVGGVTREVAAAATQIAASSEEMSQGMTDQNQQIFQISSAIEQMGTSVVEVARKSGEAANNALESGQVAKEGGEVVEQTIEGMRAISDAVSAGAASVAELGKRGEQIGKIIDVINDIADQTNLLALNAAIEAARAGEHGRGFAVVADEVRKLADRTTKATDEIGDSIKAIQNETGEAVQRMNAGTDQVASGVTSATQAGESLKKIVTSAQDVAGMIQSIAASAEQQSTASEEVSRNVESVSAVSRQASEGSQQAASAAAQLSTKAEQLQRLVGTFKTDDQALMGQAKQDADHLRKAAKAFQNAV